ncbi:unnamed protein product [Sphenostylis stenocarpa]|uniref:Uncharacterized protein n=1 Tax=Sphenostylis stenocarpa TaxID=92480 RepID=A0AA86T218_9FABA|nr:unnamed protein product [Sphenostylis stenocarpa]
MDIVKRLLDELKQNEATSKRSRLMRYHQKNSGRTRIHSSVSHPTTPDTWNMKIVAGKALSAVEASR